MEEGLSDVSAPFLKRDINKLKGHH
jgi:hypothetical protein